MKIVEPPNVSLIHQMPSLCIGYEYAKDRMNIEENEDDTMVVTFQWSWNEWGKGDFSLHRYFLVQLWA